MSQSQQLAGSEFPHLLAVQVSEAAVAAVESEFPGVLEVSQGTRGIGALVVSVGSWGNVAC